MVSYSCSSKINFPFQRNTLIDGEMSIFMYFHLYRLVAVTETALICQGCNSEIQDQGEFDSLMGENSGGKN